MEKVQKLLTVDEIRGLYRLKRDPLHLCCVILTIFEKRVLQTRQDYAYIYTGHPEEADNVGTSGHRDF